MQITINTSDILGDEATIRDEVISQVASSLTVSMKKEAAQALSDMLKAKLEEVVTGKVNEAVAIALDKEFIETDSYGREGKKGTIRSRIAGYVQDQCTLKSGGYSSDKNTFSRLVESVTESEVKKFQKEFQSLVTKQVIEQSMTMAVTTLKQSLGIK